MFVTASSPSPSHLGTVNGLAQTTVSIMRAIGPASTTSFFAASNVHGWIGGYAVYWFFVGVSCVGLASVFCLPSSATGDDESYRKQQLAKRAREDLEVDD